MICPTCERDPCPNPTFCAACRKSDAGQRAKGNGGAEPEDWRAAFNKKSNEALAERARIDELARKARLDYDRARKEAAADLGVRTETLDEEVEERRIELEVEDQPRLYPWWDVEPWAAPVAAAPLVAELQAQILKYVVMTEDQALVVALWIMMAWIHDRAVVHSPCLMVTSPQANSGKSTLLAIVGFVTPRSLVCVGLNEAVLFRSVDLWGPTLITDEGDSVFVDNEPLRAVYNSGWARGTGVLRCIGDNHTPKMFRTFCPKALGLKGKNLPDTTLSRCIIVELKRKKPNEKAEDFEHTDNPTLAELRRKLARWADDSWENLSEARPDIPAGFYNRVRRNWWALLAIAESAGVDWAEKAQKAAAAMEGLRDASDVEVELLTDIKKAFDAVTEISTKSLISALCLDEERPWATFAKGGKPITERHLGKILGKYGIISEDVRPNGIHAKGYRRSRFEDAWERYLSPKRPPPVG